MVIFKLSFNIIAVLNFSGTWFQATFWFAAQGFICWLQTAPVCVTCCLTDVCTGMATGFICPEIRPINTAIKKWITFIIVLSMLR